MSKYIDEKTNSPEHVARIERIAQQMLKADNQPVMRGWREDMENLEKSEQQGLRGITEEQFVRVFLPFFASDEVNVYNVGLSNWLTIAGNQASAAFSRVQVYDPTTNLVLFTVPPVYDNQALKITEHVKSDAIGEIVAETINLAHLSPRKSNAYFRERLASILKASGTTNVDVMGYIAEWNAIFARYNRPLIDLGLPTPEATPVVTQDTTPEIKDEYESL